MASTKHQYRYKTRIEAEQKCEELIQDLTVTRRALRLMFLREHDRKITRGDTTARLWNTPSGVVMITIETTSTGIRAVVAHQAEEFVRTWKAHFDKHPPRRDDDFDRRSLVIAVDEAIFELYRKTSQ